MCGVKTCFYCGDTPKMIKAGFTEKDAKLYFKTKILNCFWNCEKCDRANYYKETKVNATIQKQLAPFKPS